MATTAIAARSAAEHSLQIADDRALELRKKIEVMTRQFELLDGIDDGITWMHVGHINGKVIGFLRQKAIEMAGLELKWKSFWSHLYSCKNYLLDFMYKSYMIMNNINTICGMPVMRYIISNC
mgnify:CR=1 FL=1